MNTTQFLVLIGTIYLAPHVSKSFGLSATLAAVLCAAAIGFGWLPA